MGPCVWAICPGLACSQPLVMPPQSSPALLTALLSAAAASAASANPSADSAASAAPFRFANMHGDGMVLQMAPQRAQVWGFCSPGDEVTVTVVALPSAAAAAAPIRANISRWLGNSTWSAMLPPTEGSLTTAYTITAVSKLTGASSSIAGVLFGDVHFCSGQSNMDKTISYLANKTAETADMLNYPAIRMFHIGQWNGGLGGHPITPHTPQAEVQPYPVNGPSLNWTAPCTNMTAAATAAALGVSAGQHCGGGKLSMTSCDAAKPSQLWHLSAGATFENAAITNLMNGAGPGGFGGACCVSANCGGRPGAAVAGSSYCKAVPAAGCNTSQAAKCACNAAWRMQKDGTITSLVNGDCLTTDLTTGYIQTALCCSANQSTQTFEATPATNGSFTVRLKTELASSELCLDSGAHPSGPPGPPRPPAPPQPPDVKTCRGSFSAVCWMMGRALFAALDPPRPIGLIQATWGGTSDTLWSSPAALAKCGLYDAVKDNSSKTTLWNSAVAPLLRTTIRTAVWYQVADARALFLSDAHNLTAALAGDAG